MPAVTRMPRMQGLPPMMAGAKVMRSRCFRWLVHPTDRVLIIYRLLDGAYGKPDVQGLTGETPVRVIEGLSIQWGDEPDAAAAPAEPAGGGTEQGSPQP
jgi:hypothetical protein